MRHRKNKGRLSRRTSWRKATLKSLANDLMKYQRIETTLPKAKALRRYVEPLITLAKNNPDSVNARRRAFSELCERDMVSALFDDIGPLFVEVPGGYTRIMASGNRKGDGAAMAIVELTRKTVSEDKLLGIKPKKDKAKKKKSVKEDKDQKDFPPAKEAPRHAAPEIDVQEKEQRVVEDVRKEKAKSEQKKLAQKGIFKRFKRKSMG